MLNRRIMICAIALSALSLSACRTATPAPSEFQAVENTTNAYQAFAKRDCTTVESLTGRDSLDAWAFNEMRHSMQLLHGFCRELAGDIEGARDVYRRLVVEAPASFAADDAAERIRVLKISEADPGYARWTEGARDRLDPSRPNRTPIDRVAVRFPPLARAAEIRGFTIVEFGVTERGETDTPIVVDSNPPLLFDGTSIRAIRRWQYESEPQVDPSHRQLIRLIFEPDGKMESMDATTE